jgi:DNA gyrase/topoisomerase IV subunit B
MYLGSLDAWGVCNLAEGVLSELLVHLGSHDILLTIEIGEDDGILIGGSCEAPLDLVGRSLTEYWLQRSELFLPILSSVAKRVVFSKVHQNLKSTWCIEDGDVLPEAAEPCDSANGFSLCFLPDREILPVPADFELMAEAFRRIALLNPGIEILFRDLRTRLPLQQYFHFPNGVFDLFQAILTRENIIGAQLLIHESVGDHQYRIAIGFGLGKWGLTSMSRRFCNDIELRQPGSLFAGIKKGILKAMRDYLRSAGFDPKGVFSMRDLESNLLVAAAIRCPDPEFRGATRTRLGMPEVEKVAKTLTSRRLVDFFQSDLNTTQKIFEKFGWDMLPGAVRDSSLPSGSAR